MKQIVVTIQGTRRVVRTIHFADEHYLEASYRGHSINIYPMWNSRNERTGEYGCDVAPFGQSRIVDAVYSSKNEALQNALENILCD